VPGVRCSGAELSNIVNEALLLTARRGGEEVGLAELLEGLRRTRYAGRRLLLVQLSPLWGGPPLRSLERLMSFVDRCCRWCERVCVELGRQDLVCICSC
jgi:hypothetical protein